MTTNEANGLYTNLLKAYAKLGNKFANHDLANQNRVDAAFTKRNRILLATLKAAR